MDKDVVSIINRIIQHAILQRASDIHFEPQKNNYSVRLRVDGLLHAIDAPNKNLNNAITSRLKIMADLDIAEKRLPQDGHFSFAVDAESSRDCRISTCPTIYGEKIVVRLLNPNEQLPTLEQLGFVENQLEFFLHALQQPQGMILVTGPTGSGKTITLYSALNFLNKKTENILTIEDPVEIRLDGINQVAVKPNIGFDFANALRSFLRQDPDIIMLGEIRDHETANIAIRAAQTGHLVLATLHTNSAAETITRLLNMGVAHYNLASVLTLIVAQRLLRKRCVHCQHGCDACFEGYRGRIAAFELLPITSAIKTLIAQRADAQRLNQHAREAGYLNLTTAALLHAQQGLTRPEEIQRIIIEEE